MAQTAAQVVDETIRNRRTVKVLAKQAQPLTDIRQVVEELVETAAWAPFHLPSHADHHQGLNSPVPWRFYMLDAAQCRQLAEQLTEKRYGKIVDMLNSAQALIQATWLPLKLNDDCEELYEPTLANMENIAAASAAVQNLLLAATARNIPNYWSSGGILRSDEIFEQMGIATQEILLGSIFLFPTEDETGDEVEHAYSKRRDTRGDVSGWARWVE